MKTLGDRIDDIRRIKNISVGQMATALGVARPTMYSILQKDDILISHLLKINDILDYEFCTINPDLLDSVDKKKSSLTFGSDSVDKKKSSLTFGLEYSSEDAVNIGKFFVKVQSIAEELGMKLT